MQEMSNKKLICIATGEVLRSLRNGQSQFMFSSENDISVSIINTIERGIKDPQITTIFKLAEASGIKPSEFVKMIEEKLPAGFSLIDK